MSRAHRAAKWGGGNLQRARRWAMRNLPWTCWLCGHPIDRPEDFSIDHVVPISVDLSRAWDVTNWRPAHRHRQAQYGCTGNTGRGAREARTAERASRAW